MTSIEWTDATWNPVRGCSRVSRGCERCYAEGTARRFAGPGQPYEGLVRLDAKGKPKAQWNGEVRFLPERLAEPLRWRRPRRVFVNSMSDLFHEALAFEQIAAVFGVMAASPRHTFQVLTKRPERARAFFRFMMAGQSEHGPSEAIACGIHAANHGADVDYFGITSPWPIPNVWLGVSVEDQATADERIPALLQLPAAVRWVSYEPALGAVDFSRVKVPDAPSPPSHATVLHAFRGFGSRLDWIVVGGESGHGARPFDLAWARSTVAACREAGVPCFVKQLGAAARDVSRGYFPNSELRLRNRKGGDMSEWPEDLRVREWPEVIRG